MDTTTTTVPTPRLPWGAIGVLALIALFIGAAIAAVAGSQQRGLPAPYGPAANGLITYAEDGDIVVVEPASGEATAIVTGPESD